MLNNIAQSNRRTHMKKEEEEKQQIKVKNEKENERK